MYRTGYNDATQPQIHIKGVMKGVQSLLNTAENANKLYKEKKTVIIQTGLKRVNQGMSMVTETKFLKVLYNLKKEDFLRLGTV